MIGGAALAIVGALLTGQLEIEDFEPSTEPLPTEEVPPWRADVPGHPDAPSSEATLSGQLWTVGSLDTHFDSPAGEPHAENVAEVLTRARLALDVRWGRELRARVEGRLYWRGVMQRGGERAKAHLEPWLGEAFVDWYGRDVDLRVGQQILSFGANLTLAPTDLLNPRDLRDGLLWLAPEDAKLPVLAARAIGRLGPLSWTAVWVPFFQPSRFWWFGQDEALLQPALGLGLLDRPDPSIEDGLQSALLVTQRPQALPWLGDVGLRAGGEAGGIRFGASWVWVNEKLPRVRIDPELARLLQDRAEGRAPDAATLLSVQNRFDAGESLLSGRYARQHVVGLEGSGLLGTVQWDLDAAFSPAQAFVNERLAPVQKPTVTLVAGLTSAGEGALTWTVSWMSLAALGIAQGEQLLLVEPGRARGAPHTAWFHLALGQLAWRTFGDRLTLAVRAAWEPVQGSLAIAPGASWRLGDHLSLELGAELHDGPRYSAFGYFDRNDRVLAGVRAQL